MSIYNGIFNTTKNPPELNARSFAGTILHRMPNGSCPLFGMTSMTGRSKAKQSTHGYFSKTLVFSRVVANGAILAAATALVVDDASGIVVGHVLHNPVTGENVRVEAIAGLTLTIKRGFGRIAAGNIADNQVLVVVGTAYEEGSARPTPRSIQPVYASTFTQIFRNAWALTDTARASYSEMGYSNIAESKRDCMMFHGIDIESAIFFGQAKMDTTGAQPMHTTQGIIDAVRQYAPSNVHDFAGAPADFDDLVDNLLPAFQYSTDVGDQTTRVIFCDTSANRVLQQIGKEYGEVTLTQKETAYGMVFSEFKFFKGRLLIKEHPLFNGLQVVDGLAVVVDVPAVKLAYMDGRDAKEETYGVGGTNSTGAGVDSQGGSLTSECAVELINPAGCAVFTGLTAAKPRIYHTQEVV